MKNDNHLWDNKHPTAQMLGRWQPWHAGHQKLFEEILKSLTHGDDVKISSFGVNAITRKSLEPYFLEFSRYVFKSGSLSKSKVSDEASN